MNDVQQLALLGAMKLEARMRGEEEWTNFKYMAIAMHPERATQILEALEKDPEAEWERPLTNEEVADWQPISQNAEAILSDLRSLGFHMEDE